MPRGQKYYTLKECADLLKPIPPETPEYSVLQWKEVARILGIPASTVRMTGAKALDKLRKALEKRI